MISEHHHRLMRKYVLKTKLSSWKYLDSERFDKNGLMICHRSFLLVDWSVYL